MSEKEASLQFDADAIARKSENASEQSAPSESKDNAAGQPASVQPASSRPVSFKPASVQRQDSGSKKGKGSKGNSDVPRARRMKLSVTHMDPWSVTKVSFLLSIALAVIQIVAVALVWVLLNSIGLFDNITQLVSTTGLDSGSMDIGSIFSLSTVLSATTIFSIVEIVLLTVLATIGAFLYNIVSALVGGVHVTLGDD